MYKLARNPLLDRPVSFRSYTFDATPLLRMRSGQQLQQQLRKHTASAGGVKRRPSAAAGRHPSAAGEAVRKIGAAAGITAVKQNTFWKSSKINSRIKTCISTNGTIKARNLRPGRKFVVIFFVIPELLQI